MDQEIYDFFERYAGVSYDFTDEFASISGYTAFIEPYEWYSEIVEILNDLQDALDVIEEFGDNLQEDMPSKIDLKKIVASYVLGELIKNINNVKKNLNIDITDISSYDDLENQIAIIGDLLEILISNSLDDILKYDLFDKYEEDEDGGGFADVLGISKSDMPNLSFIVSSIREDYFASLDEE